MVADLLAAFVDRLYVVVTEGAVEKETIHMSVRLFWISNRSEQNSRQLLANSVLRILKAMLVWIFAKNFP